MVDFISMFTGMSERDIGLLLKSIVQDTINSQLTNAEITETDNKTPVLITNAKDVELVNDISVQAAINIEPATQYLMPEEPDGNNLKLWLKFQNAGELRDWSYQKNKSYSTGANTMPGLFSKYNDDSMLKYELYSYFNGISHYAHTLDGPAVRILPNITSNKITSFFMRLLPISLAKVLYADNIALFTKVDDDQLRYGYSVIMDNNGSLNFYIRNNYRQYHLFVKDAYKYILTDPLFNSPNSNFRFENFNRRNFLTGFEFLCGLVAAELPFHDWFFKYNPTTHNMSVINTSENNAASIFADTSDVDELPYLSCAIQEGKWTHSGTVQNTIYDNSGNNNNGSISGYTTGGQWNSDNTLTSLGSNTAGDGNGMAIDFGSITTLNTLTEFTVSFWFNPGIELINNKSYNTRLFSKGYAVADSIYIERRTAQNDIKFSFRASNNIEQTVTFSNPFPFENRWYFICCRWKTGEKLKITVNNILVESSSTVTASLSTAANNIKLFSSTRAPIGTMALFKMWNTRISDTKVSDLYYEGYHNPLFPQSENIQPVQEEDPDPIFVPFSNAYLLDKMTTPVLADYRRINSLVGNSPLFERYSVADGTSTVDPEVQQYNVPDGVDTGGGFVPFNQVYTCTDSGNSSSKLNQSPDDNAETTIEIIGSGSASSLNGKKITKAVFYLQGENSPTGTIRCLIRNASGTLVTELWYNGVVNQRLSASAINTSTHTAYTFQNTDLTPWGANSMNVGWTIGLQYDNPGSTTDSVNVKRNRANQKTGEWNNNRDWDGNWGDSGNPDDDDLVGELYEGGTGSATVEPWHVLTANSQIVAELIGSTSTLKGKAITRVRFKAKRNSSASSGTLHLQILTSTNTVKTTLTTWAVSSLTTATAGADLTWQNVNQSVTIESGEKLMLTCTSLPSNSQVSIMTNRGNNTTSDSTKNHNSTTSYIMYRTSGGSWTSDTSLDISGNIYSGGANFDAFLRFSSTLTRITEKSVNTASGLNNRKITKVVVRGKKTGSPSGLINCYIRDPNDVIKVTFSSVDINTVGTSYQDIVFENYTHNYLINSGALDGDKISIEYSGAGTSNYLELNSNKDVLEGSNTIAQIYENGNYVDQGQRDLAGKMYEGGEPDLNSRTRVAQSIEHQNSRLKGKKITRIKAYLIRTGTASGTAFCTIRNSNNDLIKTLLYQGNPGVPVSGLSTNVAAPSEITFEDTTNNYPLTVGDKVCIEFNGGDSSNQLGVLVRSVTPNYDGTNSYIRKYDEFDWDDEETTYDLCATMDEGGFFFTPDPNTIPDPTPIADKDLVFAAGNGKKSGFLECFLMEFRIYTKDISLDQADYLYENRTSISPIAPGEVLMPFSLHPSTLDPV